MYVSTLIYIGNKMGKNAVHSDLCNILCHNVWFLCYMYIFQSILVLHIKIKRNKKVDGFSTYIHKLKILKEYFTSK